MPDDDLPQTAQYSSPPCFMHELEPDFRLESADRSDVYRWRKAERERLIALRLAIPVISREGYSVRIMDQIEELAGNMEGRSMSLYWPFRGEPGILPLIARIEKKGGQIALPVVIAKAQPLEFRTYKSGDKLAKGVWNIPFPENGKVIHPDIVIAPIVGFDRKSYRLGYGGGFFDRTLAASPKKPLVIGIGYSACAIASIYPQEHDIPMDVIITENGTIPAG